MHYILNTEGPTKADLPNPLGLPLHTQYWAWARLWLGTSKINTARHNNTRILYSLYVSKYWESHQTWPTLNSPGLPLVLTLHIQHRLWPGNSKINTARHDNVRLLTSTHALYTKYWVSHQSWSIQPPRACPWSLPTGPTYPILMGLLHTWYM